ncbi:MAG: sigma-70 family RNA polymerase sigma factor [Candidatus Hydrogenedentes bacterium]|nr:sigma-70 family RNA polymerase sigma factor [Candidatus Hydrogenedentota bacterium]
MLTSWPFHSDAAVLRRVRAGDHASFRVIVDRYVHVIRAVALAYLSNPHDADDVVQDTFLRAFEARDKLAVATNLGAWLVTVAKNRCFDLLRKRTRESGTPASDTEPASAPAFEREELYQTLWEQISKLDPEMREVLMLYYFSRKRTRAIAQLLGVTPDAAAKRLQRARVALGQRMVDIIGDELGVRSDRKQETNLVMGMLGARVPGYSTSGAATSLVSGVTILKFASIAIVGLVAVATLQGLLHAKGKLRSSNVQSQAPSDNTDVGKRPSTEDTTAHARAEPSETSPASTKQEHVSATVGDIPQGRIRGIAVDAQGQALAGATVTIAQREWPNELTSTDKKSGNSGTSKGAYTRTTTTNAAGEFEFRGFPLRGEATGYYGSYEVSASKGNLAGNFRVDDSPWLFDQFIEIPLYELFSIAGTVHDESGNPLPNAQVMPSCETYDIPLSWGLWGGINTTTTDETGRFAFKNLVRGVYDLRVMASNFVEQVFSGVPVETENVEIILKRREGFAVSGTVVDDTRQGVAGIQVSATLVSDGQTAQTQSITGLNGVFTLQNLTAGTYKIQPEKSDFALRDPAQTVPVTCDVSSAEVVVVRGASISGHVSQAPGIYRYSVSAKETHNFAKRYAHIGDDGSYTIRGLAAGTYSLGVAQSPAVPAKEIRVEPGNDYHDIDFTIDPVWRVAGHINDESGNPVRGACVVAQTKGDVYQQQNRWGMPGGSSKSISDNDGNFLLDRFDREPVQVQAITNDMVSSIAGPLAPNSPQPIRLTMTPSGSIEGRVVSPTPNGMRQAILIAVPTNSAIPVLFPEPNWSEGMVGVHELDGRMTSGVKTRSNFSGRFHFPCLPAGEYEIHAYTMGMIVAPNPQPVKVSVGPQENIKDLEIRLPQHGGSSVEGKLTMKGEPLRGQKVEVQRDFDAKTFGSYTAWTNESGEYRLDGVQPGRYGVRVVRHASSYGKVGLREIDHHFEIAEGETLRFDFDLASGTSCLSGMVMADNVPLSGLSLFIRRDQRSDAAPEELRAETDRDGRFVVDGIHPGIYGVQVIRYIRSDAPAESFSQDFKVEVLDQPQNEVRLDVTAGGMVGKVKGVHPGEKAMVALVPGAIDASELTIDRMRELKEKIAYQDGVEPNGGYNVMFVEHGTYTAFAVAYPESPAGDDAAFAGMRYRSEVVEIPAAKSLVMDFDLE